MDDNNNKLKLTIELEKLSKLLNYPRFYLNGEPFSKLIDQLNEYLLKNTTGFEDFVINSSFIKTDYNDIKIPIVFIKSYDDCSNSTDAENSYIIWIIGDMSEINYTLKKPLNVKEAILNNHGLISFSIRIGNKMVMKSKWANSQYLCHEEYIPNEKIETFIFDAEYIRKVYGDDDFERNKLGPCSSFKKTKYWTGHFLMNCIRVKEVEPHKYAVRISDCDGRPSPEEFIEGESLYSAYYNYMIDNGYYVHSNNKMNRK